MTGCTEQNRLLVLADVQKQPYAARFAAEEISRALSSAVDIFSAFEQRFVSGFSCVLLPSGSFQGQADFARELIPGLLHAHRFFGDLLPTELKHKLTNQPQTRDTLFELMCLGAFQQHHAIQYEPTLADGKVPDLRLSLSDGQAVYVECKSQSLIGSKHERLFTNATDRIHKILDFSSSAFVKKAWSNGLRCEVRLSRTPSAADVSELERTLNEHEPCAEKPPIAFGSAVTLSLIFRDQPFDQNQPPPSAVMQVETTGTDMHYRNMQVAVYPWPGLDIVRRRSQRRLLASARRKLSAIPPSAYGLICIQTFSSRKFAPDIHKLLRQKVYERIPIIWLNPISSGLVIYRDDVRLLRNKIFPAKLGTAHV